MIIARGLIYLRHELLRRILKDWSIIDRLHLVRVPTLVINGREDISQDFVIAPFFERVRKAHSKTRDTRPFGRSASDTCRLLVTS